MPPEILSQIFLGPTRAEDEPFLAVQSAAVCRALLPFTRPAAYRHLTFDSPIALAAFGFTLSQPDCAHLGPLVESVNVLEPRPSRGFLDEGGSLAWLGSSFRRAFEGMANLAEVRVARTDFVHGEEMMATAGWQSVRKLTIASGENVPYRALRHLHLAPNLAELEIPGPMRYEAGFPGRISYFEPGMSSIRKLTISAEPHSAGKPVLSLHERDADVERVGLTRGGGRGASQNSNTFSSTATWTSCTCAAPRLTRTACSTR